MADNTQDIMDGVVCQDCGERIDDQSTGHPRCCKDCDTEEEE